MTIIDRLKMCINFLFDPDIFPPNPDILYLLEVEKQLAAEDIHLIETD